jgi:hypothetical protein
MPQHVNAQSFVPGDPRAIAAGRKGGKHRQLSKFSPDYLRGYQSGARNARRHTQRWIEAAMHGFTSPSVFVRIAQRLHAEQCAATTSHARLAADEAFAHFLRMAGAGRLDEWIA